MEDPLEGVAQDYFLIFVLECLSWISRMFLLDVIRIAAVPHLESKYNAAP